MERIAKHAANTLPSPYVPHRPPLWQGLSLLCVQGQQRTRVIFLYHPFPKHPTPFCSYPKRFQVSGDSLYRGASEPPPLFRPPPRRRWTKPRHTRPLPHTPRPGGSLAPYPTPCRSIASRSCPHPTDCPAVIRSVFALLPQATQKPRISPS